MVEDFTATTAPSVKVSTETTGSSKSKPPINGRSDSTNGKKTEYYIENDWMEGIAVPVFALDLSLNVTAWNQQAAESTGLRAQEIIKMPLESILQDNSRARLDYAIQELIQNNGDSSSSCDLTFCISGSLRSFHTKMSAQKNTSKELIGVVCFTEEIRPPIHPAPTSPYSMSLVFDDCDFPTVGLNLEGNIQSWSTSMVNISGYTKEEVMGRRFSEYAAAESYRQRVNEMVLATNQGKRSKPIQFELRDKHGQTRQLLLNVSASRDQNRTACGVIMVITDLSDDEQSLSTTSDGVDNPTRKQILRTSHKVEERSPLLEITTVPIFGIDRDGSNTSWNPKMSSLTGFGQEEALDGRFVRDFVCPDFQSSTQQYFERCLAGSELSCLETEIKSKDGKNIRLFLNVSPGQVQDHGLMVFATDVTTIFERWKAAEEFKMLVDTANAPVFGIDRNGCIDLWNSMAAHVLGFSRDFVMGKSLVETFIDPILRHSVQVVLDMALEGHGTSNYELEFQTESGEIRYLLANITTRRDAGGEIVGVVGFAQDVTEAAQNDRAIAAMARELRQLLDTANTPVFGVDTAGRVNEWNDKTAEITGFSSDEAFNQPFVETFMVPDLRASVQEVVDNALRGRGTSNFELEIRNKANEIRFLLVNATTRRDAENNVVGMFCVAQDVTEACKHDRAVAAMANELRQLIDTANAPIFGIDRDGDVNEWNDKTAEITGYTKEEAFDCSLVETFIVPSMRDSVQDVMDNALEGRGTSNYELEFRTKSNEIRHLLVNATTRRDAENNVVGVVGVAQDVTEAVQRDRAVAGMALELRQLIDTANAPIFGIDIDGNVNEWNRRTSEITGYSKEEAFDEPLVETFIAPSMQEKVQEILDSALEGNETSNYELEFVARCGEPRFLLVNATTRRDPENIVVGVVGVAQDVTEDRKHAQALREMQYLRASQEAKVETERNMTAYFAHELRNPLGAIDSALNAMPDDLPETAKSLVSGMQLCTGFMSSIMNNLLDVRKMEEGKMKLMKSPISLKRLLNGVHKMLLPSLRPGVDFLKVCKTKGIYDWILGDAHRIQQVMTNVVTNAIKYTVTGSVTLTIDWKDGVVIFQCEDTGPGIPKNEQEKLFQRFVQRGGAPGTGLGLAIAKHLVDLTGGSIRFDSDPTVKAGTTCVVLMPLSLCDAPETVVEESTALIEEPITFLIIDDIKMNRMMLKRRVMKSIAPHSKITEAATGEQALEICGKEKFDVIVVDQYMEEAGGVMVGTDVVFAMRRMRIDSVIIGCSGNDMGTQFFEAGADWVWQKPMPSNVKIIQDLRASLNKRHLERQQVKA